MTTIEQQRPIYVRPTSFGSGISLLQRARNWRADRRDGPWEMNERVPHVMSEERVKGDTLTVERFINLKPGSGAMSDYLDALPGDMDVILLDIAPSWLDGPLAERGFKAVFEPSTFIRPRGYRRLMSTDEVLSRREEEAEAERGDLWSFVYDREVGRLGGGPGWMGDDSALMALAQVESTPRWAILAAIHTHIGESERYIGRIGVLDDWKAVAMSAAGIHANHGLVRERDRLVQWKRLIDLDGIDAVDDPEFRAVRAELGKHLGVDPETISDALCMLDAPQAGIGELEDAAHSRQDELDAENRMAQQEPVVHPNACGVNDDSFATTDAARVKVWERLLAHVNGSQPMASADFQRTCSEVAGQLGVESYAVLDAITIYDVDDASRLDAAALFRQSEYDESRLFAENRDMVTGEFYDKDSGRGLEL